MMGQLLQLQVTRSSNLLRELDKSMRRPFLSDAKGVARGLAGGGLAARGICMGGAPPGRSDQAKSGLVGPGGMRLLLPSIP
jgi:hypothetical protein